jgi:hypothetical protein
METLNEFQFLQELPTIFLKLNEENMVENFHPPIPYLHDDKEHFLDVIGKVINTEVVEFVMCVDLGMSLGMRSFIPLLLSLKCLIGITVDLSIVNKVLNIMKFPHIKGKCCK